MPCMLHLAQSLFPLPAPTALNAQFPPQAWLVKIQRCNISERTVILSAVPQRASVSSGARGDAVCAESHKAFKAQETCVDSSI